MLIVARQAVEVRHHGGRWQYRMPGTRAWCMNDPHWLALRGRERAFESAVAKVLRVVQLAQAREARRSAVAATRATKDAAIVEAFETLGLRSRAMPDRWRAAVVAESRGCTVRHVRRVMARWRKKSGPH